MKIAQYFLYFIALNIVSSSVPADEKIYHGVEPTLQLALKQAVEDATSFPSHAEAAIWLSNKSRQVSRFVSDPFYLIELLKLIHAEAIRAGLDPELVLAVIQVESEYDRFAISASGARGLMQVMPFWVKEIGHPTDDLFHPQTNLRYGCAILSYYLRLTNGDVKDALARYNGRRGQKKYPGRVYAAMRRP